MAKLSFPVDMYKLSALGNEARLNEWDGAEAELCKLYSIQKALDATIQKAEEKVKENFVACNRDFTKYDGKCMSIVYRNYGAKYALDEQGKEDALVRDNLRQIGVLEEKVKTSDSLITSEIDKILKHGEPLPLGLKRLDQSKVFSINVKEEREEKK